MPSENKIIALDYGLACNHRGDKLISPGAKCYVTWIESGNERMQIWVRSRGGRAIVRIVATKNLYNFRKAWIPNHVRNWPGQMGVVCLGTKAAKQYADQFNR